MSDSIRCGDAVNWHAEQWPHDKRASGATVHSLVPNAGRDNDRRGWVGTFEDFEKGQAVHTRPNDVADYRVEVALLGQPQSLFGCRRLDRVDARQISQDCFEGSTQTVTIVHDEDQRATAARHWSSRRPARFRPDGEAAL